MFLFFLFLFFYTHADHPDVVSIFLNKSKKKHTTRVWKFLDVEGDNNVVPSNSAWKIGRFGEDVIIGGIDSGKFLNYPLIFHMPILVVQMLAYNYFFYISLVLYFGRGMAGIGEL